MPLAEPLNRSVRRRETMSAYSLAKEIITSVFPHKQLVSQSVAIWHGEFPLPDEVAHYYEELGPEDITIEGYGNPFFLPSLARLWEFQAGYRFHPYTNERFEDWLDDWLVIASQGGDPFIYSRSSGRILHALHGQGVWDADEMFSSLEGMVTTFTIIGDVVVSAGDDLTDEESYLREKYVKQAKQRISLVLGSMSEAEVVLDSLGWVERS